jgi:hypothetical protein
MLEEDTNLGCLRGGETQYRDRPLLLRAELPLEIEQR